MRNSPPFSRPLAALTFVSCLVLGGCAGSEDEEESNVFLIRNSQFAMGAASSVSTNGALLFFPASEFRSGNQDLNNDGNMGDDDVAIVVNMPANSEVNLGVASTEGVWAGDDLYMVVDEVLDGRDHGGSAAATELVLLHWNAVQGTPMFVATLDRRSTVGIVTVGETVFFASDDAQGVASESSLYAIDAAFPHTPRNVFTQNTTNGLRPQIIGEDEGLVLLSLDENYDGLELNGDTNIDDSFILALLDGTGVVEASGYNLNLRNTGMALESVTTPIRAGSSGAHDWLCGFLVDEASQEVNLNTFGGALPSAWNPNQSSPCNDIDMADTVLHAIRFAAWDADPTGNPPVNTGISGSSRVLVAGDALATICSEGDEGDCILNADGDFTDVMLRWIRIDGVAPFFSVTGPNVGPAHMNALQANLPGPAMAVAELAGNFVIQCSEANDGENHDNNSGSNRSLIAWLDPQGTNPAWAFNHNPGGAAFYATATWMAEQPGKTRLGLAFAESSNTTDLNDDGDMADSMPTWAAIGSGRMSFLGRFLASDKDNAGITLANGFGFFRFSEAEHNADTNGNGNATDILLVRVDFASGLATNMGILNTLTRPGIETDEDGTGGGGVFLFEEALIGTDLNADGSTDDFVPRFFQLP